MARMKIVIDNPDVAHEQEIARNVEHNKKAYKVDLLVGSAKVRANAQIDAAVRRMVGGKKKAGDVHDVADLDCPFGMPNCRNCGDPAFAESCAAAGHCPQCGTDHGIAPTSVLAKHGYRLEAE